jgi:hypothetical protein
MTPHKRNLRLVAGLALISSQQEFVDEAVRANSKINLMTRLLPDLHSF